MKPAYTKGPGPNHSVSNSLDLSKNCLKKKTMEIKQQDTRASRAVLDRLFALKF